MVSIKQKKKRTTKYKKKTSFLFQVYCSEYLFLSTEFEREETREIELRIEEESKKEE